MHALQPGFQAPFPLGLSIYFTMPLGFCPEYSRHGDPPSSHCGYRPRVMDESKRRRSFHGYPLISGRRRSFLRIVISNWYHQWHRDATPYSVLKIVLIISTAAFALNRLGFLDRLFEESYASFRWPSDHIDVPEQIRLLRKGDAGQYLPLYTTDHIQFPINPREAGSVCRQGRQGKPLIVVLVKSRPGSGKRRESVRTWWKKEMEGVADGEYDLVLYFVTGTPLDRAAYVALTAESEHYGDLIGSSFIDPGDISHPNQTLGTISAWKWTYEKCYNAAAFTMVISDLYEISVQNLIKFISDSKLDPDQALYLGYLHDRTRVGRSSFSSRPLTLAEYPFTYFPPFIDSGAVLFSREGLALFYLGSQYVKMFKFEEIYVGFVAKILELKPKHSDQFVALGSIDDLSVECVAGGCSVDENRLFSRSIIARPAV